MDALASAAGAAMNGDDRDREQPEVPRVAMDQSASQKPLAKSVELKLKKLRARLAKKELERKLLGQLRYPA